MIAGLLDSRSYAKAGFLAMHRELQLRFTIDEHGRLKSECNDDYQSVLAPLEITEDAIQNRESVVFTREGSVTGAFEAFERNTKSRSNATTG